MKLSTIITCLLFTTVTIFSQSNQRILEYAQHISYNSQGKVDFFTIKNSVPVYEINTESFLTTVILSANYSVKKTKTETDERGYSHSKFAVLFNNVIISNAVINVHSNNGKIISVNGDLEMNMQAVNSISINKQTALQNALTKINAVSYKWENKGEELFLKKVLNQPDFSYFPKGEMVLLPLVNENNQEQLLYCYKFDIYAQEPNYHANVFVNAQSGKIVAEENLIHETNVPGTAITKFSGTQNIMIDSISPTLYNLVETTRGLGIETYDLNTTMAYSTAVNYTNTSTAWTNTTTIDQVGTDAHWGAEMVYDYYFTQHNRNSIDNAGQKLISFADYGVGYQNAFWNGFCMTYGSGGGGGFAGLDICGHEITHGLTSKTSALAYQNESGALNESYSDIFGVCVEHFAKPLASNWIMGETVGGGIRSMSNPNAFGQPDTYHGTNWYTGTADNGGVHTNSGVSNFWFYLLCQGGTGINDIAHSYTVNALGLTAASKIAFRALTVYFTPNTNYSSARNLSIQAAIDLYGPCSNEVYQTKWAWYAVGVGPSPSGTNTPVSNFTSLGTSQCSLPYTASFINTTFGGDTYVWDFGDGSALSTSTNPAHTYTANGTYNVKLKSYATCASSPDSIIKNSYIVLSALSSSSVTGAAVCDSGALQLQAAGSDLQYWYTTPVPSGVPLYIGTTFTTPVIYSNTTYYVVNTSTNPSVFGGPPNTSIGTGANYPGNTPYDSLTVIQPCTLKSVVVSAGSAGIRVIELRNSSNTVLNSVSVNLPAGTSTVTLNFPLNTGYGYRLGLGAGTAMLYRNNSGVSFPYNIGNLVSITGSSNGPSTFFFFYNWEISPDNCVGTPVAVTASVNPSPTVSVNPTNTIACVTDGPVSLNGSPTGGNFTGSGVSGTNFVPSTGVGTYSINYQYTDTKGCTGYSSVSIVVSPCIGIEEFNSNETGVLLYPNPFSEFIIVKGLRENHDYKIKIIDLLGNTVIEKHINQQEILLPSDRISSGIYFIEVSDVDGLFSRLKAVKQ